jgi:anti-sigma-K factor RskA
MNDTDRDLLAGEALGALSTAERERVAVLVSQDAGAAAELEQHRATVAAIEAGVARERPPTDLFDRMLAEITPAPAAPRRRRWAPRLAAGFAAAGAIVLAAVVLTGGPGADVRAAVAGTPEYTNVSGSATLDRGALVLELENVPPSPAGHHYEVWVLRAEGGGEMEAVGSFRTDGEDARLELPLPGPGDYQAVDVSIEPDGGAAEHSGVSLAGGTFQS